MMQDFIKERERGREIEGGYRIDLDKLPMYAVMNTRGEKL